MTPHDTYQGHHADGSGVQKHSAGAIYPYVIAVRERANGQGSWDRTFELICPNGNTVVHTSHQSAWDDATAQLAAKKLAQSLAPAAVVCGMSPSDLVELVSADRTPRIQGQIDSLRGINTLIKSFGQRSARQELIDNTLPSALERGIRHQLAAGKIVVAEYADASLVGFETFSSSDAEAEAQDKVDEIAARRDGSSGVIFQQVHEAGTGAHPFFGNLANIL